MILTIEEAQKIYQDHPNEGRIGKMRREARHIYMHLTGEGLSEYLDIIEQYENKAQRALRTRLAKSSKARMSRVLRPADKVFSAPGGSIYYDMPDSSVKRFREIEDEQDLKKWMRDTWMPFAFADPNGISFCEVSDNDEVLQSIYSIEQIYEYQQDNNGAYEFIMFEPYFVKENDKEYKYLRIVDDNIDALYRVNEDENLVFLPDESYPNYFGFVPAVQSSSKHKIKDTCHKISLIDDIIELADEALVDSSIKVIYKKLHGFPRYWEYAQPCLKCNGTGVVEGKPCGACGGSGFKEKADVSDALKLTMPSTIKIDDEIQEVPKIAPDIAGYVAPDLETWKQMNEEDHLLEQKMFKTLWGTQNAEGGNNETATGRFIDVQPVNDRLNDIREEVERVESFILYCKVRFHFGDKVKGLSDNYGRRYLVESPDALLDKYNKARQAGAPDSLLNAILEQVYYTEFQGNDQLLQRMLKLMKVEPFIHKDLAGLTVGGAEYKKKVHFNEWLSTVPEIEITLKSAEQLTEMFNEYLQENELSKVSGIPGDESKEPEDREKGV